MISGSPHVLLVNMGFADYTAGLRRALENVTATSSIEFVKELPPGVHEQQTLRHLLIGRPRMRSLRSPREAFELHRRIQASSADILHIQATANPWFDLSIARAPRRDVPLVVTVHDIDPHPGDPGTFPGAFAGIRALARSADAVIVHAETLRARAIEHGIDPERIRVIRHGELASLYVPPDWRPTPSTGFDLLVFGRLHAYKGLATMVAAMPAITSEIPGARLVIRGQGAELDELLEQSLPEYCDIVAGWVERTDVPAIFTRATLVVLPYREASQSGVAALAAGFGRAALVTDVGGLAEAVEHGRLGDIVPPDDPAALADAAILLLDQHDRRHRLERSAFESATTGSLSWDAIAQQTLKVYDEAARRFRSR